MATSCLSFNWEHWRGRRQVDMIENILQNNWLACLVYCNTFHKYDIDGESDAERENWNRQREMLKEMGKGGGNDLCLLSDPWEPERKPGSTLIGLAHKGGGRETGMSANEGKVWWRIVQQKEPRGNTGVCHNFEMAEENRDGKEREKKKQCYLICIHRHSYFKCAFSSHTFCACG